MNSLNEGNERRSGKNLKALQYEDPSITQETKSMLRHSRSVSFSPSDSSLESGCLIDNELYIEDKDEDDIIELQTTAVSPYKGISCSSPVWSFQGASSVTQSPQIQTMSRPAGYDPDRIPASVFSSKLNSEWSLASNESVFSIHLGNGSFSRDVVLFGKSGDVPKYEDFISTTGTDINEIKNIQANKEAGVAEKLKTTPIIDVQDFAGSNKSSDAASMKISEVTEMSAESPKLCGEAPGTRKSSSEHANLAAKEVQEKNAQREEDREGTTASCRSESSTSTHSFNFPVFAVDNGRASSVTVESENVSIKFQSQQLPRQEELQPEKLQTEKPGKTTKHGWISWLSCFTCRTCCCLLRKSSS